MKRKIDMSFGIVCFAFVITIVFGGIHSVNAATAPIKIKALSSWGTEQSYTKMFLVPWVERVNQRLKERLRQPGLDRKRFLHLNNSNRSALGCLMCFTRILPIIQVKLPSESAWI